MSVPMIHATDLYHPPNDPDDHYDLACVFALASQGLVDLRGVVIDHPPPAFPIGDPAVASIAQLNRIAGSAVPVVTGTEHPMTTRDDPLLRHRRRDVAAAEFILDTLREASEKVVINIVGASKDVAVAANRDPDLFAERCAGIYLNAGIGLRDAAKAPRDYNTQLCPLAVARVFDLPCPVYWLPVLGHEQNMTKVQRHGSFYRFDQSEVLPEVQPALQAYFLFALSREPAHRWLKYIEEGVGPEAVAWAGRFSRNMWCTAGFLHAAGQGVTADGTIVPYEPERSVFDFIGVAVTCSDEGATQWFEEPDSQSRFVLRVRDLENYQTAMTQALIKTLTELA